MIFTVIKNSNHLISKYAGNQIHFVEISEKDFEDGWLTTDKYIPENYELVHMKEDIYSKDVIGWKEPFTWNGIRVKKSGLYKYWKFCEDRR